MILVKYYFWEEKKIRDDQLKMKNGEHSYTPYFFELRKWTRRKLEIENW